MAISKVVDEEVNKPFPGRRLRTLNDCLDVVVLELLLDDSTGFILAQAYRKADLI